VGFIDLRNRNVLVWFRPRLTGGSLWRYYATSWQVVAVGLKVGLRFIIHQHRLLQWSRHIDSEFVTLVVFTMFTKC